MVLRNSAGGNSVEVFKPQVEAGLYFQKGYDTKGQFCSYWHQINEVFLSEPESVLEIGKGTGFVFEYLRKYGVSISSVDFDLLLKPDVVGSVLNLPFRNCAFEIILCCEVLEHLPYVNFKGSLKEIRRVAAKSVILSLPQNVKKIYRVLFEAPKFRGIQKMLSFPQKKYETRSFDDLHYWEIDIQGYPFRKIVQAIEDSGFRITRTYRVFEKVYHRFFILQKHNR